MAGYCGGFGNEGDRILLGIRECPKMRIPRVLCSVVNRLQVATLAIIKRLRLKS